MRQRSYQSEVAASDEADLSLPARLAISLNIPYFDHFVCARRGEASADVRIDVQGTCRAVMRRDRKACR